MILAWLSLWVVGGLCVTCPCGRFVIRQGLGRSWQVLGRMSGVGESTNTYFLQSEYIERYGTGSHRLLVWIVFDAPRPVVNIDLGRAHSHNKIVWFELFWRKPSTGMHRIPRPDLHLASPDADA